MNKVFDIASNISTPLMLAGFLVAAFYLVIRQIIKANIFPKLTRQFSGDVIKSIIHKLFILALIAMFLGFFGYVYDRYLSDDRHNKSTDISQEVKDHYEAPNANLIQLKLTEISAVDLAPQPDKKNLVFRLKVIPLSKDKFVPLKDAAQLTITDPAGTELSYQVPLHMDDGGIRPQIPSTITLDGLIPRSVYNRIIKQDGFTGRVTVFYDNDIYKTDQSYSSDIFLLTRSTIMELSGYDRDPGNNNSISSQIKEETVSKKEDSKKSGDNTAGTSLKVNPEPVSLNKDEEKMSLHLTNKDPLGTTTNISKEGSKHATAKVKFNYEDGKIYYDIESENDDVIQAFRYHLEIRLYGDHDRQLLFHKTDIMTMRSKGINGKAVKDTQSNSYGPIEKNLIARVEKIEAKLYFD